MQNDNQSWCSAHVMGALLATALVAGLAPLQGVAGDQSARALISEQAIRAHMEFLAGDALNGRGSGTRDEWIAATYLAAQARRLGLEPLQADGKLVESIEINRTEASAAPVLSAGAASYLHGGQMVVTRLGLTQISGPLVRFEIGKKVPAGSVVLMPENAPRGVPDEAAAAALLLFRETPVLRGQWHELSHRPLIVGVPRLAGIDQGGSHGLILTSQVWLDAEAYAAIAQLPERSSVSLRTEAHDVVAHTWNAAAQLPGRDPQQPVILLTAHLDHLGARDSGADRIFNGADDDASGSVAVLCLAEALTSGPRLRRTVVFAWFGSEEVGGYGARYFVEKPVLPLTQIDANLEFEMIGRPDPAVAAHHLWFTGWERSNLGPTLASHGALLVADPHTAENFFMRSDNITLARRGVVAHTISSFGLHPDYHQPSDDLSHIDFAHMTEAIRSMVEPVRWLADSDFKPDWVAGRRP